MSWDLRRRAPGVADPGWDGRQTCRQTCHQTCRLTRHRSHVDYQNDRRTCHQNRAGHQNDRLTRHQNCADRRTRRLSVHRSRVDHQNVRLTCRLSRAHPRNGRRNRALRRTRRRASARSGSHHPDGMTVDPVAGPWAMRLPVRSEHRPAPTDPPRDIWRLRSVENDAPRADAAGTATTSVPADPLLEAP